LKISKPQKKKIDPDSPKTKEQIAIIDQFIKAQPTIKPKATPAPQNDLAEVKSGEFADNIISETLAKILIRQGKKEKAIEVYRKLIWKFPQKKVYFAAQIEELKK
jgi:tetratricopeptide (TPR) repeat protein